METLFSLLALACLVLFIIGFFSPQKSLFWYKQERTKKKSALIYGVAFVVSFVAFGITSDKNKSEKSSTTADKSSATTEQTTDKADDKPAEKKGVEVGQVLHTQYFDIVVNRVRLQNRVNTGNEFADLKPEQGNMYLIINATFKNIDNESRTLMDGSVWINYNGKDYEFDKSETLMLEGWGLFLDEINPLVSKTTNLVYKIPSEIVGDAYWQPGRADDDQRIFLGNLH